MLKTISYNPKKNFTALCLTVPEIERGQNLPPPWQLSSVKYLGTEGIKQQTPMQNNYYHLIYVLPADLIILLMQKKRDIVYYMQDIRRIFVFVFAEYLANICQIRRIFGEYLANVRFRQILKIGIRGNTSLNLVI